MRNATITIQFHIYRMINYFLQDDQLNGNFKTKKIVKEKFVNRKKYQPFHLCCPHTKRKICYCNINPICNMSDAQKLKLWQQYDKATNFYQNIPQEEICKAKQKYEKSIQKIRHLDKVEIISYLKNLKMAKLSNYTNQSYQAHNEGGYQ